MNSLVDLNWNAINSTSWQSVREEKQAEFLCEHSFAWQLIERIGINSMSVYQQVQSILNSSAHRPIVELKNEWYY